jgi:ABC-type polysaccharide/polyol phosphate transport system ATPase subunit
MFEIEAQNISKVYKLYDSPSARLKEFIFRKTFHTKFAALDNISFSIKKGETFGIIGENGAGKSTLLKILSGTLSSTSGHLKINGRISSLLELGSGFHPEFTGIENIFFYGSLLGIDKQTMQKKVDSIIKFSELGEFINYPIKTYSSGMFVRLAFSVATAVDPDILIVDEVLAVGDLHFQKKSTDKILSFKEKGKTIVFCSHTMFHIARLCDKVIWLKNGKIHEEGKPFEIIQAYETYQLEKSNVSVTESDVAAELNKDNNSQPAETPVVFIKKIEISPAQDIKMGDDLFVKIHTISNNTKVPYRVAVVIKTVNGSVIAGIGTNKIDAFYGNKSITLLFPNIRLRAGVFLIEGYAFDEEGVHVYDWKEAYPISIARESIELGILDLPHKWIID